MIHDMANGESGTVLKQTESILRASQLFLEGLYGTKNCLRWMHLKKQTGIVVDKDFCEWLLNSAEEHMKCTLDKNERKSTIEHYDQQHAVKREDNISIEEHKPNDCRRSRRKNKSPGKYVTDNHEETVNHKLDVDLVVSELSNDSPKQEAALDLHIDPVADDIESNLIIALPQSVGSSSLTSSINGQVLPGVFKVEDAITFAKKDERGFICPYCESHFQKKYCLKVHMRRHTGEMPYSCKFCSRKFRHNYALSQHIKTHTGEKPHQCTRCGRTFRQRGDWRKHSSRCHETPLNPATITCSDVSPDQHHQESINDVDLT